MIVDVVVWHVLQDVPMDELNEAVNWVIVEQLLPSYTITEYDYPKVYLNWLPLRQVNIGTGLTAWASHEREACIIVSSEPVDDEKGYALWKQYEEQLKGGDTDGNDNQGTEGSSGESVL